MKVKELKELLNKFDDEQTVVFSNYQEENEDGDSMLHRPDGVEELRVFKEQGVGETRKVAVIYKI